MLVGVQITLRLYCKQIMECLREKNNEKTLIFYVFKRYKKDWCHEMR